MKIGSFFVILLSALVALGYLLSDSLHLREDISNQQGEIERLTRASQQAEQEKQNALTTLRAANQEKQDALAFLQTANQNLQLCHQDVDQLNQIIVGLTEENAYLKEENQLLVFQQSSVTSDTIQPQAKTVQSAVFSLIAFVAFGAGSLTVAGLIRPRAGQNGKPSSQVQGHYVFL